jgi:starvation-inducible outer membrane lipoprotein
MRMNLKTVALAAVTASLPALALAQTAPSTTPPAATAPAPMPQANVPAPQTGAAGVTVAAPQARRASQLIGANIVNDENRTVGEVHDLMVSSAGGPVLAVLSVGGFLGIGERYVAMPLSELRWNSDRERWVLPGATVDSLKARPAFTYPERG